MVDGSERQDNTIQEIQVLAGEIIRDHEGNFDISFRRFAKNTRSATNNKVEAWVFYHGLKIAAELRITWIVIETDSTLLISWLNSHKTHHNNLNALLLDAKQIITKFKKVLTQILLPRAYCSCRHFANGRDNSAT